MKTCALCPGRHHARGLCRRHYKARGYRVQFAPLPARLIPPVPAGRFSLVPLARLLALDPLDTNSLADRLGIDRKWIARYRDRGLSHRQADAWATRVDFHPLNVWLDWADDTIQEAA